MRKAYFFRDISNIDELKKRTHMAKQKMATPISYHIVLEYELNESQFIEFISCFNKGHSLLDQYKDLMVSDSKGTWNCIVVKNKKYKEKIAIYYGGFKYPRFVALI